MIKRIDLPKGLNIPQEIISKIDDLNKDTFFIHPFNNHIGRCMARYLIKGVYGTLSNPEPVDIQKNTLSKVYARLRVIDRYLKLPLDKYTHDKFAGFMTAFRNGQIKPDQSNPCRKASRKYNPDSLVEYITSFKRYWKIYRQYEIKNNPDKFNDVFFDWGLNLKAPKVAHKQYEKYPYLRVDEVKNLAENMLKPEYKLRVLMSVNLMARPCEMSEVRYKHLQKKDDSLWCELPRVKKHSSPKIPVELNTYVKRPLSLYIKNNKFKPDDRLFPGEEPAFAKNLKAVSEKVIKERIAPKTLRKIGLGVAEQLGFSRADCERIGGWRANSPIINHYFSRSKGVAAKTDGKIEDMLNSDIAEELDKQKQENKKLQEQMNSMQDQFQQLMQMITPPKKDPMPKMHRLQKPTKKDGKK